MSLSVDVFDTTGKKSGTKSLPKSIFDVQVSPQLIALAVKVYRANQRQNTKSTKTRGNISYSTRKIWRQKGTGRARHSSKKAPIFVGGGRAHGPTGNEQYTQKLTKKMRKRALLGALSLKAQQQHIKLLKDISKLDPKTKKIESLFRKIYPSKTLDQTLIILHQPEKNIILATRNIKNINITQASRLNIFEILNHQNILITLDSLDIIKSLLTPSAKKQTKSTNN